MARRSKNRGLNRGGVPAVAAPGPRAERAKQSPSPPQRSRAIGRGKLWTFRLVAAVGAPLLLFAVLELGLRMIGFGYPTSFLLPGEQYSKPTLVENNHFGWRFFGPELSRAPAALAIPEHKPKDTIRVFVFGESAAFGDPQPDFGLPRMLQVMLSMRRPDLRFEMVNAGMIGINSHTVREIAQDCARADGDIWIVYMGNNEVVGPFGAGTVFGSQTPSLPVIRANLALKTTRAGQLFEHAARSVGDAAQRPDEWGGMAMFLKNRVARGDPRMERVYHHYRQNLEDIVAVGRRHDVGVVVSTVAVNLRDCAPFASDFSHQLSSHERSTWEELYAQGKTAYDNGEFGTAVDFFEQAAEIDQDVASLHFLWGRSLLQMDELVAAREHLQLACDLDQLRFRSDSRMQSIARDVAAGRENERIRFLDAALEFDRHSSSSVTGREHFYEHVHLTFDGNYLLARLIAEQAEAFLPPTASPQSTASDWPTLEECAERLAWSDVARREVLADMFARLRDPPFTAQLNHPAQLQALAVELLRLDAAANPQGLRAAAERCQRAIEAAPDDHVLYSQLALLSGRAGDLDGAYHAARKATELLPHDGAKWFQLGLVLAQQDRNEEALEAFYTAHQRNPRDAWTLHALAKTLVRLERRDEALARLREVVDAHPHFGPAYVTTGLILEEQGQTAAAEHEFRQALENRVWRAPELATLAQICHSKGWYDEAARNFRDALSINPTDASLHLGAAASLAALAKFPEAEAHFREAIQLAPQSSQLRYQYGVYLAKRDEHAAAAEQFVAAADLDPDFLNARIDCGMALIASERLPEALAQFEQVLARDPENALAKEYKAAIEKELATSKSK